MDMHLPSPGRTTTGYNTNVATREDLRSLGEWVVLNSSIEFPREALLHVEAALFLFERRTPRVCI